MTIAPETYVCPECGRELRHANRWHNCVTTTVDELMQGRPDELVLALDRLLAEVGDWPDVLASTTQRCIVFVRNRTFLVVRPMRKYLDLKFFSSEPISNALVLKSVAYAGRFENQVRIERAGQVSPALIHLLRDSFAIC